MAEARQQGTDPAADGSRTLTVLEVGALSDLDDVAVRVAVDGVVNGFADLLSHRNIQDQEGQSLSLG